MTWGRARTPPQRRIAEVALVAVTGAVDLAFWGGDRLLADGTALPVGVVPAAAAGMCAVLLLRHRYPLGVWCAAWLYTGVNLAVPEYFPFAYLLVACYAAAARVPGGTARPVLVASALPLAMFGYRSAAEAAPGERPLVLAAALASWAVILAVPWGLGRLAYSRERQAAADRERIAAEAEQALVAQRLRLAHELHDSVTGAVAGMVLHAGAARALCAAADPRVRDALEVIEQAGARAMTELHAMLGLLRSADTEAVSSARLAGALGSPRLAESAGSPPLAEIESLLLEPVRRQGLRVRLDVRGEPRTLTPEAERAAYRTIQESLTNAVKHAGPGALVTLRIEWRSDAVDLAVHSAGGAPAPGAAALSTGTGLRGLRERLDALGGEFASGPEHDGWRVHATVPLSGGGTGSAPVA